MDEFINADEYRAEVSGLIQEICSLKEQIAEKDKQLNTKNKELLKNVTADKNNPFDNPTDYKDYCGDYSEIQPRLGEPGYKIPVEINNVEFKNLKRQYSIGGWCMMFQFVISVVLSLCLTNGIKFLITSIHGGDTGVYDYMYSSSILIAVNMIVFLICNVLFTFIGLKWAGFRGVSMIKTRDFSFGKGLQYCIIAISLWLISVYAGTFVETILNKFGMSGTVDQEGLGETPIALAVGYIYSCIIAPITEEMLYRGMLLKVFSRASQRFGIFTTAFFFGIAHGNIAQFILAFVLGIFLSQITLKHNSIVPAIVVHIFVNTMSTVIGIISDINESAASIAMLVVVLLAFLGIIMLIIFRSDGNRLPASTPPQHRRGRAVAMSSIPFIMAAGIQVVYMIYSLALSRY
ncbi:MAG: CPBP family intramembrane metalloprotease [Ruminococcus sp.]|nr:CPBP family intramembrane metalloprotease [Ruminococcus sp.]